MAPARRRRDRRRGYRGDPSTVEPETRLVALWSINAARERRRERCAHESVRDDGLDDGGLPLPGCCHQSRRRPAVAQTPRRCRVARAAARGRPLLADREELDCRDVVHRRVYAVCDPPGRWVARESTKPCASTGMSAPPLGPARTAPSRARPRATHCRPRDRYHRSLLPVCHPHVSENHGHHVRAGTVLPYRVRVGCVYRYGPVTKTAKAKLSYRLHCSLSRAVPT